MSQLIAYDKQLRGYESLLTPPLVCLKNLELQCLWDGWSILLFSRSYAETDFIQINWSFRAYDEITFQIYLDLFIL